jgi:hypothetical protein
LTSSGQEQTLVAEGGIAVSPISRPDNPENIEALPGAPPDAAGQGADTADTALAEVQAKIEKKMEEEAAEAQKQEEAGQIFHELEDGTAEGIVPETELHLSSPELLQPRFVHKDP